MHKGKGKGFWGRTLHMDLSSGQHSWRELDESHYQKWLAGIGLSAETLWSQMPPGADALGPKNILGFTPGLLTDTGALFAGRFTVAGKSPASDTWADANCGGYFSPALKRCTIDGLFLSGSSSTPIYILLTEQGPEILDASDLWGLDTLKTDSVLKNRHGNKAQVACIGPAGEKKSFMAGIFTDKGRSAARGGLGAVMGAKGVKAIVAVGTLRVDVSDREKIRRLSRKFSSHFKRLNWLKPYLNDWALGFVGRLMRPGYAYLRQPPDLWRLILGKFGTCSLNAISAHSGDSPVKNWLGIGFKDFPLAKSQRIGAESVTRFEMKKYGCASCPLKCGGIATIPGGSNSGKETHKPEYETCCAFGTLLLNENLESIFIINDILNRAGMDTISCGATVAFAIECFENGLLTTRDTDGLELHWGNSEAIIRLVEKMTQRQGIGELFADGVRIAAQKIGQGSEKYAVHCGGIEAPMHDPKFDPGFLASYCLMPAPGRHTAISYQYLELQELEKTFNRAPKIPFVTSRKRRFQYDEAKVEALAVDAFFKMLIDCAGVCLFGTQVGGNMPLCEWLNAATGWDLSPEEYLTIGERVFQLRHAFNVREGINPANSFAPHPRLCGNPPLTKGPARNVTLDFQELARLFYKVMNWNLETGAPHRGYLKSLGLNEIPEMDNP